MRNMLLYFLTFLAILLPFMWFQVLADKGRKKNRNARMSDGAPLPLLFRLCGRPAELLDLLGLGRFCRWLAPKAARELQKKLHYAGMDVLTPEIICCTRGFLVLFLAVAAAAVTALIVPKSERMGIPVAAAIAAFVGWFLPGIVIGNQVEKRRSQILHAIPFSIDLVSSAMRGGLDFTAAIRFYVKLNIPGPLTDEYAAMLREMELGVIRTDALQNMAERIQIKEFTSFAAAIVMGSELGASLTDTMEIQGKEMRKLRFSIAECKAQRAPSLMLLPMALFILPAVFIVILTPVFLKMKEAGVPLF